MNFSVRSVCVSAALALTASTSAWAQESYLEGSWEGALNVGPTVLNLILELEHGEDGLDGVMISVDQGGAEIPVDEIAENDGQYTLLMNSVGARYVARIEEDALSGNFYQNGMSLSLTMTKQSSSD